MRWNGHQLSNFRTTHVGNNRNNEKSGEKMKENVYNRILQNKRKMKKIIKKKKNVA